MAIMVQEFLFLNKHFIHQIYQFYKIQKNIASKNRS